MSARTFTIDDIQKLESRIDELESALEPFAKAAEGFNNGEIELEYIESDGDYYAVYYEYKDGALPLRVFELMQAKRVYEAQS